MRYRALSLKFLSSVLIFGAWEVAGRVPVSFAFPTFLESMSALWALTIEGTIFTAYAETLKPLVVGVLISAFFGIGLGLWVGLSKKFDWFVSPIFIVMQSAPLAALIPLLIMVYGIGLTSKVFVVCIMAMPVIVLNTSGAVRNTSASIIEMGKSFLGTRKEIILKIILPSASPIIFVGSSLRYLSGLYRRHSFRVEDHTNGCWRHYILQPLHCRLSQHVRCHFLDNPVSGPFFERARAH